jgi:hypothetical protein
MLLLISKSATLLGDSVYSTMKSELQFQLWTTSTSSSFMHNSLLYTSYASVFFYKFGSDAPNALMARLRTVLIYI